MAKNQLYYGDNLTVLREHIASESVDLVYLDPPFNSRQDYNVLFAEKDGSRSSSQITAFEDTWEWNQDAVRACEEVIEGGGRVAEVMCAFRTFLRNSDMMAYLAMMAPRLMELRRVLKPTGSIYLPGALDKSEGSVKSTLVLSGARAPLVLCFCERG